MSKIGILTFNHTLNYGAELQAFALYTYLSKSYGNDYDFEIIDYRCDAIEDREFSKTFWKNNSLKNKIKLLFRGNKEKRKKEMFYKFGEQYLQVSSYIYNKKNISDLSNKYDKIIIGSDQVWNCELTEGDTVYFGSFKRNNSCNLISYAASFGYSTVPDEYLNITERGLENFDYISVREKSGIEICNKIDSNTKVELVLDPTFLLAKNEWEKIFGLKKNGHTKKYVLLYLPHNKKECISRALAIAKKLDAEIIYVNITFIPYIGVKNLYSCSPIEFLDLIYNAEYVITGSFHGVALSIIFHKNFYFEESDSSEKNGARVKNLVELAGLNDRSFYYCNQLKEVNWHDVDNKIKPFVEKSKKFLEVILK